jgi:hypothetical protein
LLLFQSDDDLTQAPDVIEPTQGAYDDDLFYEYSQRMFSSESEAESECDCPPSDTEESQSLLRPRKAASLHFCVRDKSQTFEELCDDSQRVDCVEETQLDDSESQRVYSDSELDRVEETLVSECSSSNCSVCKIFCSPHAARPPVTVPILSDCSDASCQTYVTGDFNVNTDMMRLDNLSETDDSVSSTQTIVTYWWGPSQAPFV